METSGFEKSSFDGVVKKLNERKVVGFVLIIRPKGNCVI